MVGAPVRRMAVRILVAWPGSGGALGFAPSHAGPRGGRAVGRAVSACAGGLVVVGAPVRRMAVRILVAWPGSGGALGFALLPDPGVDEPIVGRGQSTGQGAGVWGGAPVVGRGGEGNSPPQASSPAGHP